MKALLEPEPRATEEEYLGTISDYDIRLENSPVTVIDVPVLDGYGRDGLQEALQGLSAFLGQQ